MVLKLTSLHATRTVSEKRKSLIFLRKWGHTNMYCKKETHKYQSLHMQLNLLISSILILD